MTTTTNQATPCKLRSGDWGAKVQTSTVAAGDTVTITTRAGKSWIAVVEKVIWTGKGVAIVATQSVDASHRTTVRTPHTHTGRDCGEDHRGRCCGGNCSSQGTGRNCGAECCDGY